MYGHTGYNPRPYGYNRPMGTCPHGEPVGECDRGACDE